MCEMWQENVLTPDLGATNHSKWFADEEDILQTFFTQEILQMFSHFYATKGQELQL